MKTDARATNFVHPRFLGTWLSIGLLRIIFALPDRWQLFVGRQLGRAAFRFMRKRRLIVEANLQHCFPKYDLAQLAALSRLHFDNLGIAIVEMTRAWWGSDELFEDVEFEGLEHLHAALARHKSLIVITGHFTTLEISGRFLRQQLRFDALYRAYRNPLLDHRIRQGRLRSARELIEKSDIRRMIRSLKQGVCVWYAPDQSYRRKYAELLEFFDQPAMTNTATSRLVTMGKAGLLPCYCYRISTESFRYRVVFEPEIPVSRDDDPNAITRRTVASLEAAIRREPAQYFWVHRRFKGLPEGHADLYGSNDSE